MFSGYDLIWSMHYPLLDYCLNNLQIKSTHIIYNSLSPYMAVEKLPDYYEQLSLILCNSKETLEAHELSNNQSAFVFPNSAPQEFFNDKILNKELKRIAVISNHIPDEIFELEQKMRDNEYIFDVIGIQRGQKQVDKNLLQSYDLVISIGRTVNWCLALGVPVYCYDRFGGCGYFSKQTLEMENKYNFSGRFTNRRLETKELYNEIIEKYEENKQNLQLFREYALDNFCFEKKFEDVLAKLNDENTIDDLEIKVNNLSDEYLMNMYYNHLHQMQVRSENIRVTELEHELQNIKSYSEELEKITTSYGHFQSLSFINKIRKILKGEYTF